MNNDNNENLDAFDEEAEGEEISSTELLKEYVGEQKKKKHPFAKGVVVGVIAALLVCFIFSSGLRLSLYNTVRGTFLTTEEVQKINMLSNILDSYYYQDIDDETKVNALYKGMLESADDKYTEYYTAQEYSDLMVSLSGDYGGIGATLTQDQDTMQVSVVNCYDNCPAANAGLEKGDIIISVDGYLATDEQLDDFVQRIRGEIGTTLEMVYSRDGVETTVTIERAEVIIPSVAYQMLENNTGYIQVSQFSSGTQDEFEAALADLESQGMTSVIFDMRDNGGGMLDSVVAILDDLLPEGTVVYTEDKQGNRTDYTSDDKNKIDLPIVVLVNENTASAAEIFTGAIRDFDYGTVIGTTTFGKGIVQTTLPLSDGSAVKITTATYYTPSGECIHGTGITPDIELEYEAPAEGESYDISTDNQIQKALEVLNQ